MKPGTLMMLVRYWNGFSEASPKLGSIGTFVSVRFCDGTNWVSVDFPDFPYGKGRTAWECHPTEVIPLNDPDADISSEDSAPVIGTKHYETHY